MKNIRMFVVGCCAVVGLVAVACGGAVDGSNGKDGPPGASLAGADGQNGADGKDGLNGTNGSNGTDGTNGTNGTNGSDGTNGTDGQNGTNGTNGKDGTNGEAGAPGAPGANGEVGNPGANGVSLCGDVQMPEWHQSCGSDLVGSCATANSRWECHGRVVSENGDVEQFKVCADATTHTPVTVPSTDSVYYVATVTPVGQSSGRCDQDTNCDGIVDRLTDTVSYGDSNSVTVSVGDVVSASGGHSDGSTQCLSGVAVCDISCGRIKVSFAPVAGSDTLGLDCFNSSTSLEQKMGCSLNGAWVSPDYDQDDADWSCEDEATLSLGQAAVSCVAPHSDAHVCSSP